MSALKGDLGDFGISEVFQLIGQQRKTGVLELTGSSKIVRLRFDRGAVVSAAPLAEIAEGELADVLVRAGRLTREQVEALTREVATSARTVPRLAVARGLLSAEELEAIEDLLTRETIFEVLRWKQGEFSFRAEPVEHQRRREALLAAEQILMDGLRMVDEWQACKRHVPNEAMVFRALQSFDEYHGRSTLARSMPDAARRVFELIDGRLPVQRIIDRALIGSFDTVRLLADMRTRGALEVAQSGEIEAVPDSATDGAETARRGLSGDALASFGMLALLLVLVLGLWGIDRAPALSPGATLGLSPLQALRQTHAARGLRRALEAHFFLVGEWPASLDALATKDLLDDPSLVSKEGADYYYVRRPDGILLLAPERSTQSIGK